MSRTLAVPLAATMLSLSLGACSGAEKPTASAENITEVVTEVAPEVAPPRAEVVPDTPVPPTEPVPPVEAEMTAEAPPEIDPAPDEQMLDDAAATGMTARTTRGEPASNAAVPVEQIEEK